MEKNTCKLCFRSFANGRALGGHMRTHVAAAKATAKIHNSSSSSSSTSSHDEELGPTIGYGLRENPKRSFRLADPEFSPAVDADSSAIVQDRESESDTESSRRRRSKRARPIPTEPEPDSSVSDTVTEEDVAISLMMLSCDTWKNDDYNDEEPIKKGRSKYQCGTCKKAFRSYQALGGHRASHKKFKSCIPPPKQAESVSVSAEADADVRADHVCPVCSRSFASGQALGGHKRSHFASSAAAAAANRAPTASKFPIDLNLPAPTEEEEDADQMSAVFDELN